MNETIRAPNHHGRLYIFLYLCGIVLINLLPLPCFGIEIASSGRVFSVTSTNEPLHEVLAKISRATGYHIEITKSWENKPITTNLKNSTLEESIKKIINLMGNPNHAIVKNDRLTRVEIIIFDASSSYSSVGTNRLAEHRQKHTKEVRSRGTALERQSESARVDAGGETDFSGMVVAPPEVERETGSPGRKLEEAPPGFATQQDILERESMEVNKKEEPPEIEIVPQE
jgi:hypothetical protein